MNFDFGLYPVITREFCLDRDIYTVLDEIIEGGAIIVQLREKSLSKKEILSIALKFRKITRANGVTLIINDHVDIALAVEADGVHLGNTDLDCSYARKIAPDLIIGVSTHNKEEIIEAQNNKATYINVGPIFSTNTKTLSIKPLGLEYLKNVKTSLPFSVMGGIKENNLLSVLECGAKNIAMVTEITQAPSIKVQTGKLVKIINDYFTNLI